MEELMALVKDLRDEYREAATDVWEERFDWAYDRILEVLEK